MINYLDVSITSDNEEKIKEIKEQFTSCKLLKDVGQKIVGINGTACYGEGEVLEIDRNIKMKKLHTNSICITDGIIDYEGQLNIVYYFKIKMFVTNKEAMKLFEHIEGTKCYYKLKDACDEVYINTDTKHLFMKEKFNISLSDDIGFLNDKHVVIDEDFITEKQALKYLNQLKRDGKSNPFHTLRQFRNAIEKFTEDEFYFQCTMFQNQTII